LVHLNKRPLDILEIRAWAYQGTAQFFLDRPTPIILGLGETTNFKVCMHIYRLEQKPIKTLGKVPMSAVRECRTLTGQAYIGCIVRSSWQQLGLHVFMSKFLK